MIEEAHSADFTSLRLPYVFEWAKYPVCIKCDHQLGGGNRLLRWFFLARGENAHRVAWCRGDQNSSVKTPGLRFDHDGPVPVLTDVQVPCFGVLDDHLHLTCGRCGFHWLMQVKAKEENRGSR